MQTDSSKLRAYTLVELVWSFRMKIWNRTSKKCGLCDHTFWMFCSDLYIYTKTISHQFGWHATRTSLAPWCWYQILTFASIALRNSSMSSIVKLVKFSVADILCSLPCVVIHMNGSARKKSNQKPLTTQQVQFDKAEWERRAQHQRHPATMMIALHELRIYSGENCVYMA